MVVFMWNENIVLLVLVFLMEFVRKVVRVFVDMKDVFVMVFLFSG